jgi:predicted ATP-binding protein involved in virulence
MKLSRIEITNFRCFESLTIDLQPDVNVIVGINGAGKTSILDAIAMGLYEIVAANGGGGKRQRGWQNVTLLPTDIHMTPGSGDPAVRRKDYVQVRSQATEFYEVPRFESTTQTGTPASIEWTDHIKFQPPDGFSYDTSQSDHLSSIHKYFGELWQQLRQSDEQALIPFPVPAYYRATRRVAAMPELGDIFKLSLERKGAFENAMNAGADYQAMCQWLYLRENRELREKMQIRHDPDFEFTDLRAVRSALVQVLENVERVYFSDQPPSLRAVITAPGRRTTEMDLAQMSDGYRNLLAVVLDFARRLAQAHPNWENPLEAPGILLIDEIDLHLHPKWQQTVVPHLHAVFPNTQIIATTHSPYVVTTVESRCVHIVEQTSLRPCPAPTYGARVSDVVAEVMGVPNQRPPDNPTATKITSMFEAIDRRDAQSARALWAELQSDWAKGHPDAELVRADLMIRRLEAKAQREEGYAE